MKKILIIFLGLIVALIVALVANPPTITVEDSIVTSPEKPGIVPDHAFWIGGIDGGNFIYIKKHESEDNLFYTNIYNDHTGEIEYQGILQYSGDKDIYKELQDTSTYQGWDGDNLHLSNGELLSIIHSKSPTNKDRL
jgi:hypothetical protein